MTSRDIIQLIPAQTTPEGAGVIVRRSIGTRSLPNLDPFLMLDYFSSDNPDDYIAGFPDHPHRGFNTFTYMVEGRMEHRDSMGHHGRLDPGSAQWMKAASGVIHSEMPRQIEGLMRGFQLWINLPAQQKMTAPAYQEYPPETFPVQTLPQGQVKVLVGRFEEVASPIQDTVTDVQYLDIHLDPNGTIKAAIDPDHTAFLFVFEGEATIQDQVVSAHHLAVLGHGDSVTLHTGDQPARLLLVSGHPLHEPIAHYGPFVMNTQAELEQALADYRHGTLVRTSASEA